MAAPTARLGYSAIVRAPTYALTTSKVPSLAEKLDMQQQEAQRNALKQAKPSENSTYVVVRQEIVKSFPLHIGADLQIPTENRKANVVTDTPTTVQPKDPFEGIPLRAWAERMGERIMPAYELIKDEQKRAKLAARHTPVKEATVPLIPHILPFTRWASKSADFRDTFIAEDSKTRKKARLSWYHPDDTMVPRNWFKGGLLEDLRYYAPFGKAKSVPSI